MPKRRKTAAPKKAGSADALEALKRIAGGAQEPDVAVMKRGGDVESPDDPQLKRIFDDAAKSEVVGTIKWLDVECPHCGDTFEVRVDSSQEGQDLVQDCQSCSRSVTLSVEVEEGEVSVVAYQ
ncbi:MAG: CPXCG motif-containing cysteine-rich protein [Elusimicrobia bacterium]|nr:CPXCG motif-containing cysteine-rich protein [Elusimicrobiota bacterium]